MLRSQVADIFVPAQRAPKHSEAFLECRQRMVANKDVAGEGKPACQPHAVGCALDSGSALGRQNRAKSARSIKFRFLDARVYRNGSLFPRGHSPHNEAPANLDSDDRQASSPGAGKLRYVCVRLWRVRGYGQ